MDYEKKYKQALERAREWYNKTEPDSYTCIVESIFPELKESEDKKIREALIKFHKSTIDIDGIKGEDIIAWLEKQESLTTDEEKQGKEDVLWCIKQAKKYAKDENEMGTCWFAEQWLEKQENKPVNDTDEDIVKAVKDTSILDMVETKFNVGDWIVFNGFVLHVDEIVDGYYRTTSIGGIPNSYDWAIDDAARLWTIADAKCGDVLYLQKDGKEHIIIYKGVIKERFRTFVSAYCAYNGIVDAFCFADVSRYIDIAYRGIMPATKEQRELLWQKMKEAGYMWDSDSKQLLSLEAKPSVEKKNAWSEEDKDFMYDTLCNLTELKDKYGEGYGNVGKCIDWLKSFSPQNRWKPSKEQIIALRWVLNNIPYNKHKEEISGLLDQIKDL